MVAMDKVTGLLLQQNKLAALCLKRLGSSFDYIRSISKTSKRETQLMNGNVTRYMPYNIHVIVGDKEALLYDVLSSKIYRVALSLAKKVDDLQTNVETSAEAAEILDNLLGKFLEKAIDLPGHSSWITSHVLPKLTLSITSKCNLRCEYCYANHGLYANQCKGKDMSEEDAKAFIDKIVSFGVQEIESIQFFGGEPTLRIDTIQSVCMYCKHLYDVGTLRKIPSFTMISNLAFNPHSKIAEIIKENNIHITVSIDGPASIHDSQRKYLDGTGSYSNCAENAKRLSAYIDAIEATYTIHHVNKGITVPQLRHWLSEEYNVPLEDITVVPVEGYPALAVDEKQYRAFLDDPLPSAEDRHILSAYFPEEQIDLLCTAGYSSLCVMPDGEVYPCHMYQVNPDYCLGNLNDFDETATVLGEKLENLLHVNKFNMDQCIHCWARNICHMCPAKAQLSHIDLYDLLTEKECSKRKKRYEAILLQSAAVTK